MDLTIDRERGAEIGVSRWQTITQQQIQRFAGVTNDHQFIHVDPERAAAEGYFGGTVAHGFLILSLIPSFGADVLRLPDGASAMNYGLDKLRFIKPVYPGQRVRGRFTFAGRTIFSADRLGIKLKVAIEIEDESKLALLVDPLILLVQTAGKKPRVGPENAEPLARMTEGEENAK